MCCRVWNLKASVDVLRQMVWSFVAPPDWKVVSCNPPECSSPAQQMNLDQVGNSGKGPLGSGELLVLSLFLFVTQPPVAFRDLARMFSCLTA